MLGNMCLALKPERTIPDAANSPDWCPYAESAREDVREMLDFDRMGLTGMPRDELMKLMLPIGGEVAGRKPAEKELFDLLLKAAEATA